MSAEKKYADGYPIKLVRDRIGERLGGEGTITYEPTTSPEQHLAMLRAKLIEEAVEYLLDTSVAELADVAHGGVSEVERAAVQKFRERGGFIDGMVMVGHHAVDGRDLLPDAAASSREQDVPA